MIGIDPRAEPRLGGEQLDLDIAAFNLIGNPQE